MHACFSLSVFLFVGVCWCLHELVCVDVCETSGADGYLGVSTFSVCAFFLNSFLSILSHGYLNVLSNVPLLDF